MKKLLDKLFWPVVIAFAVWAAFSYNSLKNDVTTIKEDVKVLREMWE